MDGVFAPAVAISKGRERVMGNEMDEEATAEVKPATSVPTSEVRAPAVRPEAARGMAIPAQMPPQPGVVGCPTCGGQPGMDRPMMPMAPSFVYAIGRIEARFPTPSIEKEFAQAAGRAPTVGKTDQQTFHEVLSQRQNRYLARQLCWVLTVQGLETYILQPRDPADFDLLVEAIRPRPSPSDLDVVIGVRGPIAPPELCNGLMVPIVAFDQLYSFTREELIKAIPRPNGMAEEQFGPAAEELFDRIMQMTDNAGSTDEHRALNYLAVRYPAIYAKAAEEFARDFSLSSVEVRPSALSGTRRIVEVVFGYTNRNTDFTEKFAVRCDMTEEFPFLVTKMSPYYDR
jgi:cyclic patellamide precursor peptide PatG